MYEIYEGLAVFGAYLGLPTGDPTVIIARIIRALVGFLGILFLLLILLSGLTWMLSGADDEKRGQAKKTLINAIIGLIIIFSSYSIVQYVVGALLPRQ